MPPGWTDLKNHPAQERSPDWQRLPARGFLRLQDMGEQPVRTVQIKEPADPERLQKHRGDGYRRDANELPIRHLIALCRYYHVSADYILGLKDEMN